MGRPPRRERVTPESSASSAYTNKAAIINSAALKIREFGIAPSPCEFRDKYVFFVSDGCKNEVGLVINKPEKGEYGSFSPRLPVFRSRKKREKACFGPF
jgi:hypothetical protein